MGAPGKYVLCPQGHEILIISDNLYWDDSLSDEYTRQLYENKCPKCGELAKYEFYHYGDINDCIDYKLIWNKIEERWIIPKEHSEKCLIKRNLK